MYLPVAWIHYAEVALAVHDFSDQFELSQFLRRRERRNHIIHNGNRIAEQFDHGLAIPINERPAESNILADVRSYLPIGAVLSCGHQQVARHSRLCATGS